MRNALALLAVLSLSALAGCSFKEGNPHHNPGQNPSCFADAQYYPKPAFDIKPTKIHNPGKQGLHKKGIPIRYISDTSFFIKHPFFEQTENELPRLKYYVSTNSGEHWSLGGAFGKGAEYSQCVAGHDAEYWVRFAGPGIAPLYKNGGPHRVYIIDNTPPKIKVKITPGPWLDKKKKIPHIYRVGDVVRVSWSVTDVNIDPKSVQLSSCIGRFLNGIEWDKIGKRTATIGSAEIRLSPEAVNGGIKFRIMAKDKAGNIGLATSRYIDVQPRTRSFRYTRRKTNTGQVINKKRFEKTAIGNVDKNEYVTSDPKSKANKQKPMGKDDPARKFLKPVNLKSKTPTNDDDAEDLLDATDDSENDAPKVDSKDKPDYSVTNPAKQSAKKTNPNQDDMDAKISDSMLSDVIINKKQPKKHVKNPDLIPVQKDTKDKDRASVKDFEQETKSQPKSKPAKTQKVGQRHKKGWPTAGLMLHGGISRCLNWLPADAKNYKRVSLQFSSDGGKTWKTVCKKLRAGQANLWYVPSVNSKKCKIQIVGIDNKGGISVLKTSKKFTVNTKQWDDFDFDQLK